MIQLDHQIAMDTPSVPNIFGYATSELCQDCAIAYLLSWADPSLRSADSEANSAGLALLESLLSSCTPPVEGLQIQTVSAGRQWEHIDVWCVINKKLLLIIEDKTGSAEQGEQIASYLERARGFNWEGEPFAEVRAIYMKTGDETQKSLAKANCGVFLRRELLNALAPYAQIRNTIVQDFVNHLKAVEARSNAYLITPPENWSWQMVQGFYAEIERRMASELAVADVKWEQVNPPSGAFLALHWCWRDFSPQNCTLYLQLMHGTKLMLRLADWDEALDSERLYSALELAQSLASNDSRFTGIGLMKAGRFRGGATAGLVTLFADSPTGFPAVGYDGLIDLKATIARIRIASEFANSLGEL